MKNRTDVPPKKGKFCTGVRKEIVNVVLHGKPSIKRGIRYCLKQLYENLQENKMDRIVKIVSLCNVPYQFLQNIMYKEKANILSNFFIELHRTHKTYKQNH